MTRLLHPLLLACFNSAGIDPSTLTQSRFIVTDPSTGRNYFAKTGHNVAQMRGEVESLRAMSLNVPELVPRVIGFEIDESAGEAGMVSQYFDLSSSYRSASDFQTKLGRLLAEMHKVEKQDGMYGFHQPTHCGVTEQDNTWEQDWAVFFRDRRLGDLVRRIGDKEIKDAWERLQDKWVLT